MTHIYLAFGYLWHIYSNISCLKCCCVALNVIKVIWRRFLQKLLLTQWVCCINTKRLECSTAQSGYTHTRRTKDSVKSQWAHQRDTKPSYKQISTQLGGDVILFHINPLTPLHTALLLQCQIVSGSELSLRVQMAGNCMQNGIRNYKCNSSAGWRHCRSLLF